MNGILKSTSWTLVSSIWLSLSNILFLKFLSELIEPEIFGQNLYIYSNAILVGSVFGLGVGTVVNQSQSIKESSKDKVYNSLNTALLFLFVTILVFFTFFLLFVRR